MKKTFLLTFSLLLFASFNSFGQTTINAGMQFPTGDIKNVLDNGYGVGLTFDFSLPVLPFSLAVSTGYNRWKYNDNSLAAGHHFYAVPVMAGIRFYSSGEGVNTYIGGDLGMAYYNSDVPGISSETKFTFSPVLGFRYKLTPLGLFALDFNVRYWVISQSGATINWFGLNGGITLGL